MTPFQFDFQAIYHTIIDYKYRKMMRVLFLSLAATAAIGKKTEENVVLSTKAAQSDLKTVIKTAKTAVKDADSKMDTKEAEFELMAAKKIDEAVESGSAVYVQNTRASKTSTTPKFLVYKNAMENPTLNRRKLGGSPTKSPSSGLHKPTWRPSSKPAEHRTLSTREERLAQKVNADTHIATAVEAETKVETETVVEELKKEESINELEVLGENAKSAVKSAETTLDKNEAEFEVNQASAMEKAVESGAAVLVQNTRVPGSTKVKTAKFLVYNSEMENPILERQRRALAGTPTKSPSSGLHKPTWKPSSKPVEHSTKSAIGAALPRRKLAGSPTKSPSSGLHKPTWKPSSKPNEHRKLAGSPTKSPSSGLHKPTWKPSSKPAEHRTLKVNDNGDEVDCPPKEGEESSEPAGKSSSKQGASFILDAPEKQLNLMATGGKLMTSSYKAGSPTKSPSSGLHKPTWKPSSKPNEHRKLGSAAMKAAAKSSSSSSSSSSSDTSSATKKTIAASKVTLTDQLV